ncbi:MAG: PilX N-terminal domain-containing pilus assembly protein [bacterium]
MGGSMRREGGAVLFVALIMLLLMTLLAVAAMRLTTTNLQAVGNEQFGTEAQTAADFALDQTVNNKGFIDITASTTQKVSLTQEDSTTDPSALSVTLSVPGCKRHRLIKKSELVTPAPPYTVSSQDLPCFGGLSSGGLTTMDLSAVAASSDDSLCTTALFNVQADVNDPTTKASVTVNQGIELRMETADAEAKCTP